MSMSKLFLRLGVRRSKGEPLQSKVLQLVSLAWSQLFEVTPPGLPQTTQRIVFWEYSSLRQHNNKLQVLMYRYMSKIIKRGLVRSIQVILTWQVPLKLIYCPPSLARLQQPQMTSYCRVGGQIFRRQNVYGVSCYSDPSIIGRFSQL